MEFQYFSSYQLQLIFHSCFSCAISIKISCNQKARSKFPKLKMTLPLTQRHRGGPKLPNNRFTWKTNQTAPNIMQHVQHGRHWMGCITQRSVKRMFISMISCWFSVFFSPLSSPFFNVIPFVRMACGLDWWELNRSKTIFRKLLALRINNHNILPAQWRRGHVAHFGAKPPNYVAIIGEESILGQRSMSIILGGFQRGNDILLSLRSNYSWPVVLSFSWVGGSALARRWHAWRGWVVWNMIGHQTNRALIDISCPTDDGSWNLKLFMLSCGLWWWFEEKPTLWLRNWLCVFDE